MTLNVKEYELLIKKIWLSEIGELINEDDSFAVAGGNSMSIRKFIDVLERKVADIKGIITSNDFLNTSATPNSIARKLVKRTNQSYDSLVVLKEGDPEIPPLYLFHPWAGTVGWYVNIVEHMTNDQTIIGIQDPFLEHKRDPHVSYLEWMHTYVRELKLHNVEQDTFYFAAYSSGIVNMLTVAKLLRDEGWNIGWMGCIDPGNENTKLTTDYNKMWNFVKTQFKSAKLYYTQWFKKDILMIPTTQVENTGYNKGFVDDLVLKKGPYWALECLCAIIGWQTDTDILQRLSLDAFKQDETGIKYFKDLLVSAEIPETSHDYFCQIYFEILHIWKDSFMKERSLTSLNDVNCPVVYYICKSSGYVSPSTSWFYTKYTNTIIPDGRVEYVSLNKDSEALQHFSKIKSVPHMGLHLACMADRQWCKNVAERMSQELRF